MAVNVLKDSSFICTVSPMELNRSSTKLKSLLFVSLFFQTAVISAFTEILMFGITLIIDVYSPLSKILCIYSIVLPSAMDITTIALPYFHSQ